MDWIRRHLAVLVIVGALLDTAVFGAQGYQIHLLNSQQAQITVATQKAECWAHILDKALKNQHPTVQSRAALSKQAEVCVHFP